ncbi:neuropeptide FF receptor 1-like, partial [Penaeus japonicus]|uniref:neuropeptide FF receptor 1-like n=1 Tax=Penaeus japonicus TaxID=27405 RepID=UPI001C710516
KASAQEKNKKIKSRNPPQLDQYEAARRGRDHPVARKHRRRLLSLLFVILLVFAVCYTPYTSFLIVRAIVVPSAEEVDIYFDVLWWVSHWLAYLNSALNPLIYGCTNEGFRRAWQSSCRVGAPHKRRLASVAPADAGDHAPHRPDCGGRELEWKGPVHQRRPVTPLARVEQRNSLAIISENRIS